MSSRLVLIIIILLAIFTRYFGLDWGQGLFFHPDENNMAHALSQLTPKNLNPHFYAYGQFPLYLGFFSLKLFSITNSFLNSIFILRFWSASFSVLTIVISIFMSKYFFEKKWPIFPLLLIFTPGLIQLAHFGTTESLLIFVFLTNIFISLLYYRKPTSSLLLVAGLVSGIGLASKLTAAFFVLPLIISLFLTKNRYPIFHPIYYLFITVSFGLIFSPFNLVSLSDFLSTMRYETSVALGTIKVFYTNQFLGTTPYLFQLFRVFPYSQGLPALILGLLGLLFIKDKIFYSLVLFPTFIYFLYNGQLYTKWFRFMSPVFFILPLLASYLLVKIKNNNLALVLILISILPGVIFLTTYLHPDIRVQASNWMVKNIPSETIILSEAGNVVNIPVGSHTFQVENIDFYNLDNDIFIQQKLATAIKQSQYIIVPSRRIFMNQNNSNYPVSQKYYQDLFSGQSGFQLVKTFTPNNQFILSSENAEETYSVFDNPTIRIYKKYNEP